MAIVVSLAPTMLLHSPEKEGCFKDAGTLAYHSERAHRQAPLLLQLPRDPLRSPPQAIHHLPQVTNTLTSEQGLSNGHAALPSPQSLCGIYQYLQV